MVGQFKTKKVIMSDSEFKYLIDKCGEKKIHISYSFHFGYISISLPGIAAKTFHKTDFLFDALNYINA